MPMLNVRSHVYPSHFLGVKLQLLYIMQHMMLDAGLAIAVCTVLKSRNTPCHFLHSRLPFSREIILPLLL